MPTIHSTRILLSFLFGSLAALALPGPWQGSRAGEVSAPSFVWPPPPEDILHIWRREDQPIPPGGFLELVDVPRDRYLVLEWGFVTSPEADPFTGNGFDLHEETNGGLTLKSNAVSGTYGRSESGTGAVFRPGSKLVVENATGLTSTELSIFLAGYFRDAN